MPGENAMQPREAPGPNGTAVAADTLEQAHRELENVLARYRDLFELASDGYVLTDRTGVIQDVNRAVIQALETRKEFLVGKPLPFLAVPERRPELFKLLGRLNLTAAMLSPLETRLQPRHGPPRDVELVAIPHLDRDGAPHGYLWLLRDVTSQRRTEAALRAEQEFAASVLETAQVFVLVLDHTGRVLRCNRHVETVSGYGTAELEHYEWG